MNTAEPRLPSGIWIGVGLDLAEQPVVRLDIELKDGETLTIALPPAAMRTALLPLEGQEDRRVRVLVALLKRQADILDMAAGPGSRLVGVRES